MYPTAGVDLCAARSRDGEHRKLYLQQEARKVGTLRVQGLGLILDPKTWEKERKTHETAQSASKFLGFTRLSARPNRSDLFGILSCTALLMNPPKPYTLNPQSRMHQLAPYSCTEATIPEG